MKSAIQFPLLTFALGILLLPLIGCSSTQETSSAVELVAQPTAISSPSNLNKPVALQPRTASQTDEIGQIKARYALWKQSWADMKIDVFMSFYSPKVRSGNLGYQGIRERKLRQWQQENYIGITDIGQPIIKINGNSATLSALQVYDSNTWWDKGQKNLSWQKSGGRWVIVSESFKAQSQRSKAAPVVAAAPPPLNQTIESQPVPDTAIKLNAASLDARNADASSRPIPSLNPNKIDCKKFSTQAEAQAFFIAQGGPENDPYQLDGDHDGVACERLPR